MLQVQTGAGQLVAGLFSLLNLGLDYYQLSSILPSSDCHRSDNSFQFTAMWRPALKIGKKRKKIGENGQISKKFFPYGEPNGITGTEFPKD